MKTWSRHMHLALLPALVVMDLGAVDAAETLPMIRQTLMNKVVQAPAATLETHVIRVQFPPGFKSAEHTHDGPGPRYVVSGRVRVEDSGQTKDFGPGDVFWETGGPMTIANIGGSDAEMVIFELAPAK
ncbi:MAG: cupin domain-containing protein [Methylotetracoccus sp.]